MASMKGKKDYCRACKKEIPFTIGPYRGHCGYNCYMKSKRQERRISDFIEVKGGRASK